MEAKKSFILILEDDETLGLGLKETLSRAGYNVLVASNTDDATDFIRENQIDYLFCDCLLPNGTGLDFIEDVGKIFPQARFKIILMSGIYTDKSFMQEAIKKTQAYAFLKKPFELTEVLKLVKKEETQVSGSADLNTRKNLYQLFAIQSVSNQHKKKLIQAIDEVSGFDLPLVYSLLSETKSTGKLTITSSEGTVSVISFSHGNIVGVNIGDGRSKLGEMLIQSGYCSAQDVQEALNDPQKRRIGSFLIQNNRLSPHAFDLILLEQMNLRLVSGIVEDKLKVNFTASEVELLNPSIDSDALLVFFHDWVASKITVNWLKSLFMLWFENSIIKSSSFRPDHPAMKMPLIKSLEGLAGYLEDKPTMTQLLENRDYNEITVYKGIYFLLTKGLINFAAKSTHVNPAEHMKFLKKIWMDLDGKNEFQIVTYLDKSGFDSSHLDLMLHSFLVMLGAEPEASQKEANTLWKKIKTTVEHAISISADPSKIEKFREATIRSDAEAKFKANKMMEEVKSLLHLNQFAPASAKLAEIAALNPQVTQFHIYNSWAKLGMPIDPAKKGAVLKDIELELMQVPADEKYDALFSFVNGLVSKNRGDINGAKKFFEKSTGLDSSFMPARRELNLLDDMIKKQDVFNIGIKDMLGGIFKKK